MVVDYGRVIMMVVTSCTVITVVVGLFFASQLLLSRETELAFQKEVALEVLGHDSVVSFARLGVELESHLLKQVGGATVVFVDAPLTDSASAQRTRPRTCCWRGRRCCGRPLAGAYRGRLNRPGRST
jgi:hypothetical protein